MDTLAVILEEPEHLVLGRLDIVEPGEEDVVVDIEWSGISTGTERLLYTGRMPEFPGMGYPLVPGYESVGRVVAAGPRSGATAGARVFVPGARCFGSVRGLFGGAAARVVLPGKRATPIGEALGERGVLLALAATAYHATASGDGAEQPDLIIGHGALGRIMARLALAAGAMPPPIVYETNPARRDGASGYSVLDPADDDRRDYQCICDVSGDPAILDSLIARLAPGGEIILAGFYEAPLSFAFPPAFMREARIRVAAQWLPADLCAVRSLAESGALDLGGLITHRRAPDNAGEAYRTAFGDPSCLKMVLDWRQHS
ncbi:chlorophyll synthesis pathway protein BchC [Methylocella silvestris]|uniref:Chlorophyll synthesis pathway protein BchC n=1 Tax=Methylocella silvestris TaxID=199596 RepID=A0A2J7TDF1_METSI|nr:chlorophyll synthesis pathway protein BchC [Methylocella silvestris]PNG24792.1 chlorophyll synthesis pathway protein BchC [Methylocella silvestris]